MGEPVNLIRAVEKIGRLLGILSGVLLMLSVFYDFSFLAALGLSFAEVPTTISDHVRSAIIWMPEVVGVILVFCMFEMFMRRVEGGLSEEELIASSSAPRFIRGFRLSSDVLLTVVLVLISIQWTLWGVSHSGLYLSFVVLWGLLSSSIVRHQRLGKLFSRSTGRLFILLPIIVSIVGFLGYQHGLGALSSQGGRWEVEVRLKNDDEEMRLRGLRRFESAVIIVDTHGLVSVLPAHKVGTARLVAGANSPLPNICRWFGILCPGKQANK